MENRSLNRSGGVMTTTGQQLPPDVRAIGAEGEQSQDASDAVGRTGWDFLNTTIQSKMLWIAIFTIIGSIFLYLFAEIILSLPIYAVSSVLLSVLWYNPICSWLSRYSTYIEVWEPESGLLTTYRVGRQKFAEIKREGLQNQVTSRYGNSRIFASDFNEEDMVLQNTWVHQCDPWTYHRERRTLNKLTKRVSEVFTEIVDGEAIAQVEGRVKAMEAMRRHYKDLDSLFFGTDNEVGQMEVEDVE